MLIILILILGLVIGSFLNVLIDRIPRTETLLGRSHCEDCHHELSWKDLIPVFSFVFLRGKCRYCHNKLSLQYPLIEIIAASLFVICYIVFPLLLLPFNLFLISIFIVIFFVDLKYGIIPDKIILPSVVLVFIYQLIFAESIWINLTSGLISFGFFYFLYLITKKRGMGFGDVKFALLIGLIFGFPATFYVLYIAFLTGAVVGTILVLWSKKKLKSSVPFGPFLVFGCVITLFLFPEIQAIVSKIL